MPIVKNTVTIGGPVWEIANKAGSGCHDRVRNGRHQRIGSLTAFVMKIICTDIPNHGSTQIKVEDVLALGSCHFGIVVTHPCFWVTR